MILPLLSKRAKRMVGASLPTKDRCVIDEMAERDQRTKMMNCFFVY